MGFEPTGGITPPAIFKTAAFNRSATLPWGRCWDSNPEPSDYKSAALPIEPHRHGRPGGLPPALTSLAPFCLFLILGCTPETYEEAAFHRTVTDADADTSILPEFSRLFSVCGKNIAHRMAGNIFALFFTMVFCLWEVLPLSGEPALRRQPVLGILRDEYGSASEAVSTRLAAGISPFKSYRAL